MNSYNINPRITYRTGISAAASKSKKQRRPRKALVLLMVLAIVAGAVYFISNSTSTVAYQPDDKGLTSVASKPIGQTACSTNTSAKLVIVGLEQQRMWACNYNQVAYSSLVVTGYTGNPADVTPTGNYIIESKQTDLYLKGSDGVTSWDDYVNYWMQFLYNQYGAYGFHDATWRTPNEFGHISTASTSASHGCVEMPLATAKWLYGWAEVGTNVSIRSSVSA